MHWRENYQEFDVERLGEINTDLFLPFQYTILISIWFREWGTITFHPPTCDIDTPGWIIVYTYPPLLQSWTGRLSALEICGQILYK